MNGIQMKDCNFYVVPEKRTVVCVLPTYQNVLRDVLWDMDRDNSNISVDIYNSLAQKIQMPHRFIGKAVCSPEDTFDEETGRMIAFYKAKQKFYNSYFNRVNLFINKLDSQLDKYVTTFQSIADAVNKRQKHLEHAIKERVNF